MNISTRVLSAMILLVITLFASSSASAKNEFDGSANLICAAFDVMACLDGGICSRGEARSFEMPEFMNVDFKANTVHATYDDESEKTATSPIKNSEVSGSQTGGPEFRGCVGLRLVSESFPVPSFKNQLLHLQEIFDHDAI